MEHGPFEVLLEEEKIMGSYTVRTIVIREMATGDKRKVTQFHYTDWSNRCSMPEKVEAFLDFIEEVIASHSGPSPVVVHCRWATYQCLSCHG